MIFYQSMANACQPHFFICFVTNFWPMSPTHIFSFIFYKSMANAHHPHFVIHPDDILPITNACHPHFLFIFLPIYSQCLSPTFFYSFFRNLWPMPATHIFVFTPWPMPITNIFLSILLLIYSQCLPPTFLYSPQPPHNTIFPAHIYPPGVAPLFMHLVGF